MQPDRICYSYRQAAEATSASRTTLYRLVKSGQLEARNVVGRVFITKESLDRVFGPRET